MTGNGRRVTAETVKNKLFTQTFTAKHQNKHRRKDIIFPLKMYNIFSSKKVGKYTFNARKNVLM